MSTARSATFAEAAERPNSQLYDRRKVLPFRNSKQPDTTISQQSTCRPEIKNSKGYA